jgi:hypothetical protein
MAWTTPPTFVTSAVLSAAQLNVLSADVEYLNGFVSGANPAMTSTTLTDDGDILHIIRHLHRYLHCMVRATGDVKVYYDTTQVFHDGSPGGDEGYIVDLNSFGLTAGQLYTLKFSLQGADNRTVYYAYESESSI